MAVWHRVREVVGGFRLRVVEKEVSFERGSSDAEEGGWGARGCVRSLTIPRRPRL